MRRRVSQLHAATRPLTAMNRRQEEPLEEFQGPIPGSRQGIAAHHQPDPTPHTHTLPDDLLWQTSYEFSSDASSSSSSLRLLCVQMCLCFLCACAHICWIHACAFRPCVCTHQTESVRADLKIMCMSVSWTRVRISMDFRTGNHRGALSSRRHSRKHLKQNHTLTQQCRVQTLAHTSFSNCSADGVTLPLSTLACSSSICLIFFLRFLSCIRE